MRTIFLHILLIGSFLSNSYSQVLNPVRWKFSADKISNNDYQLKFEAHIDEGWHMYGLHVPEGGPIATTFVFENEHAVSFSSDLQSLQEPAVEYDSTFEMQVESFSSKVVFVRRLRLKENAQVEIKGTVSFMTCDNTRCLPPKEAEFAFIISEKGMSISNETENPKKGSNSKALKIFENKSISIHPDSAQEVPRDTLDNSSNAAENSINKKASLLGLFLLAFIAGFGAILTPCVYPIIPLTVSYFMRNNVRTKAVLNGILFGISIVFIYTLIGFITGLTRIDLVRLISSHWIPNLIFFLIFLALAFSFFGMFEINLPGSLSNKIDRQADKGGLWGPFFMALATVVISFSCTGPIVGVVLGSAMHGELIRPIIGMFGFSLSFALPFTLLAIFPGLLKNLPKSGGWLNSVKIFFAFILLAFSLVFISNLGLKFITYEMVLAITIVIFFLLGLYLIGLIKFVHDSQLVDLSVPRLLIAIATFSFTIYLITGLFGAPLKSIAPFLPPKKATSIDLSRDTSSFNTQAINPTSRNICSTSPKYSDFLYMPLGLKGYFDFDEALACARELNKPVLLDFAGHGCKNCKKMYAEVWSDRRVLEKLNNDFIVTILFTDDRTKLLERDWVTSRIDGKVKTTIGKKFNDLQITLFESNALPLYAIVDKEGNILTQRHYYEYDPNVEAFLEFLNEGLKNFSNQQTN